MGTVFRRFEAADFDFAITLTEKEKWYLTPYDLAFYVTEGQGTGLVAVEDGVPVGFATAAIYGRSAWIGNVIVEQSGRNRGLGRKLVEAHMQAMKASGVDTFLLYAYDRSKPLYERLGFLFDAVLWEVAVTGIKEASGTGISHGYDTAIEESDMSYFPCSRKNVLRRSSGRKDSYVVTHRDAAGNLDGYLFASHVDSEYGSEVAPFVCRRQDAHSLISASARAGDIIHLYVPQHNIEAIERLEVPFQRVRTIHRGYLGSPACLPYLGPEVLSAGFLDTG